MQISARRSFFSVSWVYCNVFLPRRHKSNAQLHHQDKRACEGVSTSRVKKLTAIDLGHSQDTTQFLSLTEGYIMYRILCRK